MPISLKKGQKVSLSKENPGLTKVLVGLGWDVNAFDTGGSFDLDAAAFLLRCSRCAGARLVQTAYEQTQHTPDVTRHAVLLLQLSENILARPLEALVHLIGIDVPEAG